MENAIATLAVSNNWLDNTADYTGWTYPIYTPTTTTTNWTYTHPSKIRLKLSEVERLRAVAKKDAGVRAILQKFSPLIEIEVDF